MLPAQVAKIYVQRLCLPFLKENFWHEQKVENHGTYASDGSSEQVAHEWREKAVFIVPSGGTWYNKHTKLTKSDTYSQNSKHIVKIKIRAIKNVFGSNNHQR